MTAAVTSAAPLDADELDRVAAALEGYTGKAVRLDCAVDSGLLGGVIAKIDGMVIDGSVATRLERIREALLSEEL